MNEIDITKFCAPDDVRVYLRQPMRSSHGVIACNGHVLICVQREGAFPEAPESLNKPIEGFGSIRDQGRHTHGRREPSSHHKLLKLWRQGHRL